MTEPSDDQLRTAIMKVDLLLKSRQAFWETWKALATILIAAAAIAAAGGLAGQFWPAHPTQVIVHFDQPINVKVIP
jgi:hypothetical protein